MDGLTRGITRHKKLVIAVFLVAAVISAVLILGVSVNYDLTDYLPEDSESTIALDLMYEEFGSGVPNTRVMVQNLTLTGAVEMKEKIAAAPGVSGVMWLDDTQDMSTPIELMDEATVEQYWRDGTALYQVTIDEGRESEAVEALYGIIGEGGAISGNAASTASMQNLVVSEVVGAACILVPIIIIILLLTTTSWISPILFLLTIGVAVIINMGTNIFFGEISFVTQSVSPIMQLAVSLDYAIFLLNSFGRHRQEVETSEEAMRLAIKESFSEFNGDLKPLCDFWFGNTRSGNNGTVFAADITDVEVIGEVKHPSDKPVIEETRAFSKLPRTLIYPRITTEILIYMINKGIANLTLLPQALIAAKA